MSALLLGLALHVVACASRPVAPPACPAPPARALDQPGPPGPPRPVVAPRRGARVLAVPAASGRERDGQPAGCLSVIAPALRGVRASVAQVEDAEVADGPIHVGGDVRGHLGAEFSGDVHVGVGRLARTMR